MNGQHEPLYDLVVLVADNNMQATLKGILGRPEALGIRPITWEIFVHPQRDPGCLRHGSSFLSELRGRYSHALLMFDRHGSGREELDRVTIENQVEEHLVNSGWGENAAAICLDPELECWVWGDSPEVAAALGWVNRDRDLRFWLREKGLWMSGRPKPLEPKKALEAVLFEVRKPRSSAIYGGLAERVSLQRCSDPAFQRLRQVLLTWFLRSGER